MPFTLSKASYNPEHDAVAYPTVREHHTFEAADAHMRYLTETRHIGLSITIPGMELARNSYWTKEHWKVRTP